MVPLSNGKTEVREALSVALTGIIQGEFFFDYPAISPSSMYITVCTERKTDGKPRKAPSSGYYVPRGGQMKVAWGRRRRVKMR